MKKKFVCISTSDIDILAQINIIREYRQKSDWEVVVVAVEYSAQIMCNKYGVPFKTTMDYFTPERRYKVFIESLRFAKEWYKEPGIEETLSHKGVSLCEMMEYDFYRIFSGLLLDIELYREILEAEKPDKIGLIKRQRPIPESTGLYITDMEIYDNFIVPSLSDEEGIPLEWITPAQEDKKSIRRGMSLRKHSFYQALNYVKEEIDNMRLTLRFDRRVELRHYFQRLWNFCFCSWTARRPVRMFSQKKRKIALLDLRCTTNLADHLGRDRCNGLVFLRRPGERQRTISIVPPIYLESFSTPGIDVIVEEKRSLFMSILGRLEVVSYFENKFCYDDTNFWPVMRKKLEYILDVHLPLMVRGMELIKEMVDKVGLDILISSSDQDSIPRVMMKALQHEGGKTLVVQHGLDYIGSEASEVFGKLFVPLVTDKIAAWGEAPKDWLISQRAPSDRIEATSNSDFDDYIRILNYPKDSIRRYLRIPPGKSVILYALGKANRDSRHAYVGETRDEVIQHLKDVIKEVAQSPQLYLVVRPHPGDRHPEEIKQIVRDEGQTNIVFHSKLPLPHLLRAADILVTYCSSTALEAMIFENNVIIYNPTGRAESVPFVRDGAALHVGKKEDLIPKILEVSENDSPQNKLLVENRKKFVRRCAGPIDGNATKNIANLILSMVR